MTDKDLEINTRLMEEFNLEPGDRGRVYDRESGDIRTIRGKEILTPGSGTAKGATEFDPINSVRMMNYFFGSYIMSMQQQGVLEGEVVTYGTIPSREPGKVRAMMKLAPYDNPGSVVTTTSKAYNNETSAFADLVCRINGDEDADMSAYDIDRQKQAEEARKAAAKAMKFKKNPKRKG